MGWTIILSGEGGAGVLRLNYTMAIHSEDDFPAPVAGLDPDDPLKLLHPLVPGVAYEIDSGLTPIEHVYGLAMPGNVINGSSVETSRLHYTGDDKAYVVSGTSQINNLTMDCPTGQHLDLRGVGVFFAMNDVRITNCDRVGTASNSFWVARGGGYLNIITSGLVHSGSNWVRIAASNWVEVAAGDGVIGHDFGTIEASFILFNSCDFITTHVNAVSFSGLVDSGNISAAGKGEFASVNFSGAGTPLVGINHADLRWLITNTGGVQNSSTFGATYMRANTTETVISVQGSDVDELGWVPLEGTFDVDPDSELWDSPSNSVLRYIGRDPTQTDLRAHASLERVSGGSVIFGEMTIFKNPEGLGSYDLVNPDAAGCAGLTSAASSFAVEIRDTAITNDLYRIYVRNLGGTQNILGTCAQLIAGQG